MRQRYFPAVNPEMSDSVPRNRPPYSKERTLGNFPSRKETREAVANRPAGTHALRIDPRYCALEFALAAARRCDIGRSHDKWGGRIGRRSTPARRDRYLRRSWSNRSPSLRLDAIGGAPGSLER